MMVYNTQDFGFLDFFHRLVFQKKHERTQRFENGICFRPQVRGGRHSVGSVRKS
jgi:hypothetical protein